MKLTIDTETDSIEDLQNTLSIISKAIQKKNGNANVPQQKVTQQVQQESIKKPNMDNPYVKRLVEQEKLSENMLKDSTSSSNRKL